MRWLNDVDLLIEKDEEVIFRHIGWKGQTGRFYNLGEDPKLTEPGSFWPIYAQSPE